MTKSLTSKSKKSMEIEILTIIIIVGIALLALLVLWRAGVNSRSAQYAPPKIFFIGREADAFGIWRTLGVKDRVLIHFSGHMPTKRIAADALARLVKPRNQPDERPLAAKGLDDENYLYAASRANFVRKIFGVVPDNKWEGVKAKLRGNLRFSVTDDFVAAWMDGLPITSSKLGALSGFEEPVILSFGADYFTDDDTSAGAVVDKLRRTGIKFDLVTITAPSPEEQSNKIVTAKLRNLRWLLAKLK